MKKIVMTLAAITAAIVMVSCSKGQLDEPEQAVFVSQGSFTVTASTVDALTKTSLYGNDTDGYDVLWSEGDMFTLFYETAAHVDLSKDFTLVNGAGTTTADFVTSAGAFASDDQPDLAVYPSSIVKKGELHNGYHLLYWPDRQEYQPGNIKDCPMLSLPADFNGPYPFRNLGGILRIRMKGAGTLTRVSVSSYDVMAGDAVVQPISVQGYSEYVLFLLQGTGKKEITMDLGEDGVTLSDNWTEFCFSVPEGRYRNLKVNYYFTIGEHEFGYSRTCTKDVIVERSKITDAALKDIELISLPGKFTVNEDGDHVCFSRGNLYWDGSSFKFEDGQADFPEEWTPDHVSHFFWSKDAAAACAQSYSDASEMTDFLFTNADATTANPDFTVNGQKGKWRALSGGASSELYYILNKRKMEVSGQPRYSNKTGSEGVMIDGNTYKGLFIYPDDYAGATVGEDSVDSWTEIYESGIVFLPAAGSRSGSDVIDEEDGPYGYYWTSVQSGSESNKDKAYSLRFNPGGAAVSYSNMNINVGRSIRLVIDSN